MTDEELLEKNYGREDFDSLEGKDFQVRLADDAELSLTLDAVEALQPNQTSKPNIRKEPFALLFWGAADTPLENALHHLTPEGGDPMIIYLDKKELDEEKNRILYEAVFN